MILDVFMLIERPSSPRKIQRLKMGLLKRWSCYMKEGVLERRILTAGSAKKEIANTEKQEATILPIHVCGTMSPYPIVVTDT